jgi:hypothetical protein
VDYDKMIVSEWKICLETVDTVLRYHKNELTKDDYIECPMDSLPPISSFIYEDKEIKLNELISDFSKLKRNAPDLVKWTYNRVCNYLAGEYPPDPKEIEFYQDLYDKYVTPVEEKLVVGESLKPFEDALKIVSKHMEGHSIGMRYPTDKELDLPSKEGLDEILKELISTDRLGCIMVGETSMTDLYKAVLKEELEGLSYLNSKISDQVSNWINKYGVEDKSIKRKKGFHGNLSLER